MNPAWDLYIDQTSFYVSFYMLYFSFRISLTKQ